MNQQTKEAAKYSFLGIIAVLLSAAVSNFLAPETEVGQNIRFAIPLLTGLIAGLWIHLKFRGNFADSE